MLLGDLRRQTEDLPDNTIVMIRGNDWEDPDVLSKVTTGWTHPKEPEYFNTLEDLSTEEPEDYGVEEFTLNAILLERT